MNTSACLNKLTRILGGLLLLSSFFLSAAYSQEGYKGERRAPNPVVNRGSSTAKTGRGGQRTRVRVADQVENAIELGNTARDDNDFELAGKYYRRAIKLAGNDWRGWYGLGNIYNDTYHYADGLDVLTKAVNLNPEAGEAEHSLGTSYYFLRRYLEAAEHYHRAVNLQPSNAYWRYDLGMAFVMAKDTDSARQQYEIIKNQDAQLARMLNEAINAYRGN